MSGQISSFRFLGPRRSRNTQPEGDENEFSKPANLVSFLPPRTPLHTIQDPLQSPRELSDSRQEPGVKLERLLEKISETSDLNLAFSDLKRDENGGSECGTPRWDRGTAHSEPNSAQSTPARSVPRLSSIGASGAHTASRSNSFSGPRGGGVCKAARGISNAVASPSVEVPYFELVEDPSFWRDHNVQVLIRVRPINDAERASEGYARCLKQESAQTLTWLGHPETRFTFDHIACETTSQEKLFRVAGVPMVDNCMAGYNSCMFAYGQTGSGKTYTMMGEMNDMNEQFSIDCGTTPRIFQYLFTQIRLEEEKHREEKLKYSCKCSFLEIYNEQIIDLLEPTSANLQLREDVKKGVYVENLKEFEVMTVKDVIELLLKGAANRKMAATHMNSESSRSHSVFTCVIESRWEKDSMAHFRFGRLNLVDLAGSERQKSSGAEGERLKEAANINKSLSTLGLVIMTLVDVAHGKQRHVPYRDSRLTFLLQDSLGGNSKTAIIANVSPSICSAGETLSTLKFAQRAKLIQNNAKVNHDASGDVLALQQQIQKLKDELNFFLKHQNIVRPHSLNLPSLDPICHRNDYHGSSKAETASNADGPRSSPSTRIQFLEATLHGALRREKIAETAMKRLEAEIALMNRLVQQRDEDAQHAKMMLRLHEEKSRRQELFLKGLVSADEYLTEENAALLEEVTLLQARLDKNPEVTQFALENVRLIEQLRVFQGFYHQGEREILSAEISDLRDQILEILKEGSQQSKFPPRTAQGESKGGCCVLPNADDEKLMQADAIQKDLEDCRRKLEACLETNARLTREADHLRCRLMEHMSCKGQFCDVQSYSAVNEDLQNKRDFVSESTLFSSEFKSHIDMSDIQKLQEEIGDEAPKRVICLQEEIASCQRDVDTRNKIESSSVVPEENKELKDRLSVMLQENIRLKNCIVAKNDEISALTKEWEMATLDLTSFISDGFRSLQDAFHQVDEIVTSFSHRKVLIGENVGAALKVLIEKDILIGNLEKRLEETVTFVGEMEKNLSTLKGATLAITEVQHLNTDETVEEIVQLRQLLTEKILEIGWLKATVQDEEDHSIEEEKCAEAASISLKWPYEMNPLHIKPVNPQGNEVSCSSQEINDQISPCGPQLVGQKKLNQANYLLQKFEEAQETMKEADLMLNALLKLNEDTRQEADGWKHACGELRRERIALVNEVEKLEESSHLKDKECESLQEEISETVRNVMDSIGSLECSLLHMRSEVEEQLNNIFADIFSFGQDLLNHWRSTKSCLEDIWSNMMERTLMSFVLYQCHLGNLRNRILSFHSNFDFLSDFQSITEADHVNNKILGVSVDPNKQVVSCGEQKFSSTQIQSIKHAITYDSTYLQGPIFEVPSAAIFASNLSDKDFIGPDTFSRISMELGHLSQKIQNHIRLGSEMETADSIVENMSLRRELAQKNVLLEGLVFDLRLLQEYASNATDRRNEAEVNMASLIQVQHELEIKGKLHDHSLVQLRELKSRLAEIEAALSSSNSELDHANEVIKVLSSQNTDLKLLLEDMHVKKMYAEEQLEEKKKAVEGLEIEILQIDKSVGVSVLSSIEDIENKLRIVSSERDQYHAEVASLNDKLEVSIALADENEAIAIEARQLYEASKIYADQKEEEAKILEHSVEELEYTVNVLEKKVHEQGQEVEQNRKIKDGMEVEIQELRQRILAMDNITESMNPKNSTSEERRQFQTFREDGAFELYEAERRIDVLQKEKANQAKEIKRCKEYIAELVLHAEAQASLYAEKYKTLEGMVNEVKADKFPSTNPVSAASKTERSSSRARGSSSPFKCISGLVQQMNSEKEQELSVARLRIEELETIVCNLQRQVCMLRARLAATESMTHDVIRDLLGIKLDITNYASLVDQQQIQKLAEKLQQQLEESNSKEQEILGLRKQINDFNQERKSLFDDLNQQEAHIQHVQSMVEQLQQRDHLLRAQNEMLKMDKANLKKKIAELEQMVKSHVCSQNNLHQPRRIKESSTLTIQNEELSKRLANSEKLLSRVNNELAQYRNFNGKEPCSGGG